MVVGLGIIALVLVFVIIFYVARASELVGILKGENVVSKEANRMNAFLLLVFMILFLVGSVWSVFHYMDRFLPQPASEHGVWIDSMFNWTLFFTGIVFIITQILLFWFAYKYRAKEGKTAYYLPHNNKLEIIWTAVPAVVLTILVAMGIDGWNKITAQPPADALVVEVTAQQFNWIVRYPGKDGALGQREFERISAENTLGIVWEDQSSHDDVMPMEIHMPVNKTVVFKLGAKDVLHSFYLPHFRVKQDCVPGIPTQFTVKPTITTADMRKIMGKADFDYILACAELCGQAHWNMRVKVVVESEEEYNKWLAEQKPVYAAAKGNEAAPAAEEAVEGTETVEPAESTGSDEQAAVANNEDLISAL